MRKLTRIGDLDPDRASLEGLAVKLKSLLEAVKVGKLDITEALGAHHFPVFNDSDAHDFASGEEISDGFNRRIVREVSEMSSEWRTLGKCRGGTLTNRIACIELDGAGLTRGD